MKSAKIYEQEQLMRGSHTIATWVALQRMYRRRTKSGLGRFLNVHPNTITYWEKGGAPKYYHLKMMARYWDIDVSQIIVEAPKNSKVNNKNSQNNFTNAQAENHYRSPSVKPKKPLFSKQNFVGFNKKL